MTTLKLSLFALAIAFAANGAAFAQGVMPPIATTAEVSKESATSVTETVKRVTAETPTEKLEESKTQAETPAAAKPEK